MDLLKISENIKRAIMREYDNTRACEDYYYIMKEVIKGDEAAGVNGFKW